MKKPTHVPLGRGGQKVKRFDEVCVHRAGCAAGGNRESHPRQRMHMHIHIEVEVWCAARLRAVVRLISAAVMVRAPRRSCQVRRTRPYGGVQFAVGLRALVQSVLPLEHNLLLSALPPASLDRLRRSIRVAEFQVAERIYEAGAETPEVLFPLDGIVSLVSELEDGTSVEVAMVGAEGAAGVSSLMGVPRSPHLALTQGRGLIALCDVRALRDLLDSDGAVRDVLLRWMHAAYAQASTIVVCNRVHEADLRLAHWLLLIQDRSATDEISVTQEFLGLMLGARRATINEAMRKLVESGSIEHSRGRVRVIDRRKLESQSCECYGMSVAHYETALGLRPCAKSRVTPID